MHVYSGKCRLCETGLLTPHKGLGGEPLHTGDIVLPYTRDECGVGFIGRLTVVVCDQFQTYSTGDHVLRLEPYHFYVMGIASSPFNQGGEWSVMLLKKFDQVIEGEHWPDFGFRYSNE